MTVHKRRPHGDVLMRPREGGTMRRLLAIAVGLTIAAAYFTLSALPAFSADNGTVNAQVTVQGAVTCITLSTTSLDYGPVPFSQPSAGAENRVLFMNVNNCGDAAKLFGSGTDAKNGAGSEAITWTLDDNVTTHPCTLGVNRYSYVLNDGPAATWGVGLSTANKQLLGNSLLGSGAAATIYNLLKMPCAGSDGSGLTMSWQIVYTATL